MKDINILLWAYQGAGLHYWGPGMSAYNLYNSPTANERNFSIELAHGYNKHSTYSIYQKQHLITPITASPLSHILYLSKAKKWINHNYSRFDVFHGLSTFHIAFMPAYWMTEKGKPAFLKIIGTNSGLKKSSLPSRLLGWEKQRKKNINNISGYIAISNEIKDELLESGVNESRIHLIPNGVNTQRFKPATEHEKDAIRNKLGLQKKFTFVFTGGISTRKRPSLIVEACALLKQKGYDFQLLLVGPDRQDNIEGPKINRLIEQHDLSKVVFRYDFVSQIEDVYKISNVFILPSSKEGMSNSLLEAMSSGLPSIVTKVSGMSQLIFQGKTGTYISQNTSELSEAMDYYLINQAIAKEQGTNARYLIESEFSSNAILNKHIELFRSAINKTGQ